MATIDTYGKQRRMINYEPFQSRRNSTEYKSIVDTFDTSFDWSFNRRPLDYDSTRVNLTTMETLNDEKNEKMKRKISTTSTTMASLDTGLSSDESSVAGQHHDSGKGSSQHSINDIKSSEIQPVTYNHGDRDEEDIYGDLFSTVRQVLELNQQRSMKSHQQQQSQVNCRQINSINDEKISMSISEKPDTHQSISKPIETGEKLSHLDHEYLKSETIINDLESEFSKYKSKFSPDGNFKPIKRSKRPAPRVPPPPPPPSNEKRDYVEPPIDYRDDDSVDSMGYLCSNNSYVKSAYPTSRKQRLANHHRSYHHNGEPSDHETIEETMSFSNQSNDSGDDKMRKIPLNGHDKGDNDGKFYQQPHHDHYEHSWYNRPVDDYRRPINGERESQLMSDLRRERRFAAAAAAADNHRSSPCSSRRGFTVGQRKSIPVQRENYFDSLSERQCLRRFASNGDLRDRDRRSILHGGSVASRDRRSASLSRQQPIINPMMMSANSCHQLNRQQYELNQRDCDDDVVYIPALNQQRIDGNDEQTICRTQSMLSMASNSKKGGMKKSFSVSTLKKKEKKEKKNNKKKSNTFDDNNWIKNMYGNPFVNYNPSGLVDGDEIVALRDEKEKEKEKKDKVKGGKLSFLKKFKIRVK